MTQKLETRTIAASVRTQQDAKWTIFGHAVTYNYLSNPLGDFREVMAPGCFAAHLALHPDIPCLYQHDSSKILGRTTNRTLQIMDGPQTLDFRCQLDENQQWARDLWHAIDRRDVNEMSFAFIVNGDSGESWDTATDDTGKRYNRRTIKRALLKDVSPVVGAAYSNPNDVANVAARARVADYVIGCKAISTGVKSDAALRAELARKAEEIRDADAAADREARALKAIIGDPMSAKEVYDWQRKLDARAASYAAESKSTCPASGPCVDPGEHERAADYHTNRGHAAQNLSIAERHFRAADFHRCAARDKTADAYTRAQGHCRIAEDANDNE